MKPTSASDTDNHPIGWAIGQGESYADRDYQDQVEAEALYDILERDVIPTFYDRRADGLPRRWISLMMSSISSLCPQFNTNRMIREYTERFYLPAHADHQSLIADGAALAKSHAAWKKRIRSGLAQCPHRDAGVQTPPGNPRGRNRRLLRARSYRQPDAGGSQS